MSEEENGGLIRTVTAPYRSRSDDEMNAFGLVYGLLLVVVLIPLIPFLVVIWLISKLTDELAPAE